MLEVKFVHRGRTVYYRQSLVPVDSLDRFRVTEQARFDLCKPCPVHLKCWSCPGQNSGFARYNEQGNPNCLLYLFWTETDPSMPHTNPYEVVLDAYRTVASYATFYGRRMETRLRGKEMIDGRCSVCRVCTAAETLPRPCAYPEKLRSSLEALGVNVIKLSQDVFGHPLRWYHKGGPIPAYVSVIHGVLTDVPEQPEIVFDPAIGPEAEAWLADWMSAPGTH